jgi:hypothetical protein
MTRLPRTIARELTLVTGYEVMTFHVFFTWVIPGQGVNPNVPCLLQLGAIIWRFDIFRLSLYALFYNPLYVFQPMIRSTMQGKSLF